jgi:hypothetical protein
MQLTPHAELEGYGLRMGQEILQNLHVSKNAKIRVESAPMMGRTTVLLGETTRLY